MRYSNISDLYKQVQERKLTPNELEDREKIAKKLPMDDFKKRYGKDAMAVKMAVATNIAKGKSEELELDENVEKDISKALGKTKHKVSKKGNKVIVSVSSNDEADAQRAMKNHPMYVAGKLRVVAEEIEEDAKMGKQSDDNLKSLMKKFRDMEKKDPKMPSTQFMIKKIGKEMKKRGLKEETELDEKSGDIPDLKDLVGELQNASKLHLGQSKRVQSHVDMMNKAGDKGPDGVG